MESNTGRIGREKYWEIIADNLSKAGWSWGCVSAIDSNGETIWIADPHRDEGSLVLVRLVHVALLIVNADRCGVRAVPTRYSGVE